jgi:uncharacterized membrane protein
MRKEHMATFTLGVLDTMDQAKDTVRALQDAGFKKDEISVLAKDDSKNDGSTKQVTAAVVSGATTGGLLGALAGLLVGVGVIIVPGIGPLLAGGPLLATLGITGAAASTATGAAAGAVAGGAAGGLIASLMKAGLSEDRAKEYEARIREGGILVGVSTDRINSSVATTVFTEHSANLVADIG